MICTRGSVTTTSTTTLKSESPKATFFPIVSKVLDASFNELRLAVVGNLSALESLKLNDNQIEGVFADLAELANLSHVDLSSNKISGIWDPCASVKTLQQLSRLPLVQL